MPRPRPQPFAVYRVGGSVRDELLGRPVVDHDWVVVGGTPEILLASGYKPVGKDFPVFLHPETREEYALARTERKHGRGYRGFEFFASPEVTLEDDLQRRDLTINAMARSADGVLVDPYHGADDLRDGVLRHVSEAFREDPLRVLRVARFAARFDFRVAPPTQALMRDIVASGELATLAPERVWQELARGLMERWPSRMLAVLRECGALASLLPEVDALFGAGDRPRATTPGAAAEPPAVHLAAALDWGAAHASPLAARYATLALNLERAGTSGSAVTPSAPDVRSATKRADALSARLRVPADCRDAARLAARWHRAVADAATLTPARMLDLLMAADALRRPERLDDLLAACRADACSAGGGDPDDRADADAYPQEALVRAALSVVRKVDAGAVAVRAVQRDAARVPGAGDPRAAPNARVAEAIRAARIAALRAWKRARDAAAPQTR